MITSYSNKLYEVKYFGRLVSIPEILCTQRYCGTSIREARRAIFPLDPGCTGIIKNGGTTIEVQTEPSRTNERKDL